MKIQSTQYSKATETYCLCPGMLTSGFWLSFLMSPFRTWSVDGTSRAQWGRAPVQRTQRQRNRQLHSADHWKDTAQAANYRSRSSFTRHSPCWNSPGVEESVHKRKQFLSTHREPARAVLSKDPTTLWGWQQYTSLHMGKITCLVTPLPHGSARIPTQVCLTVKAMLFLLVTCYGLNVCLPSPNSMWKP